RGEPPALEAGGSADKCSKGSVAEVPETLPSQPACADSEGGEKGPGAARPVCLATAGSRSQGGSARSGATGENACEGHCGRKAARHVPETAAESLAIQRTQSLTTQEVPETAQAWGSAGACDGDSPRVEGPASGRAMTGGSTCPQSEVLETQQSQVDATQSTAESPEVRGGGGGGGGRSRGSEGESGRAADAERVIGLVVQRQSQGRSLPSSSTTLSEDVVVAGGAESVLGGVSGQVGPESAERPGGAKASSPGSLGAGTSSTRGAVDGACTPIGRAPKRKESPVSDSRKRSADSATPSLSRRLVGSESDGKRRRSTPPAVTSLAAAAPPCRTSSAATGDAEPSSGELPVRDRTRRGANGGRRRTPTALREGGVSEAAGDESEVLETGHDLAAVQDAWHAEGDYEFGTDTGFLEHVDETEEIRPPPPPSPVEARSSCGKSSPRKKSRANVANPYAPQAHLDLHASGDDRLPVGAAGRDSMLASFGDGDEGERPARPENATGKARGPRTALRRPSKGMMSFSAPPLGGVAVASASQSLSDSIVAARLKEKKFHRSRNKILGAGRGPGSVGTTPPNSSVDDSGGGSSWAAYDMGPDTQDVVELQALVARKRAQHNPSVATTTKPDRLGSVDPEHEKYDDDDDDGENEKVGREGRLGGRQGEVREVSSAEKKRKRTTKSVATTGKAKPPGQAADPRRVDASMNSHESRRRHRRRRRPRGRPVMVVLGCDRREIERAKLLCERLGQRLETELVSEAT
ncbi:unnamed protein product, partial [Hapterophycus canaliculatus]